MSEYRARQLYNVSTAINPESETYESMWAYYIRYPQTETNIPGRFRIRITRMTASEFMAMMGLEEGEYTPSSGYSIQGYIEKWSDKGWIQCLDWIGPPDSTNDKIEKDLLEMYRAFTTGQTADIDQGGYPPPSPPPLKSKTVKPGGLTVINFPPKKKPKTEDGKATPPDPDFDWV